MKEDGHYSKNTFLVYMIKVDRQIVKTDKETDNDSKN